MSLTSEARQVAWFHFVILIGFYFLVFFALSFRNHSTFLYDPDLYWHVTVGRTIWETKTFPHFDQLSHTFSGHTWIAKEWLGQVLFYGAYSLDGWRGAALLEAGVVALAYALLFLFLSRSMRLTVALGISAVAFCFSAPHFNARPQVFADPLIVIWCVNLVKAVEEKRAPSPILFPVMTLWANLHPSFTFGFIVAGLMGAEAVFTSSSAERLDVAKRWMIFLIVAVGCACLTPYGYQPFLATFNVFGNKDVVRLTQEWQPAVINASSFTGPALFALLFLAFYRGLKLPFWRLVGFIFVLYLALAHWRFLALFALVAPILLATPLIQQFQILRLSSQVNQDPRWFADMARVSRRWLYRTCLLISLIVVAFAAYGPTMDPDPKITPKGAVDYIDEHQLVGNIYNPFNMGGYLIFRGIKTFIDGRTDQLFQGFMANWFEIVMQKPAQFIGYLRDHDVSLALVSPNSLEAQELERSADWQKVYADSVSELYQRR